MTTQTRKVCFTGPTRLTVAADLLCAADCTLVLGKSVDDFRSYRYERRELINLIGDSDVLFAAGREFIGGDILDSCPQLQAVVKSSIGIENVDVDAATDLGILCCNSPTLENYMGVAEATVGLMVALFKRLKFNEAVLRSGGWKEPQNRGTLMLGRTIGLGCEASRLRSLRSAGDGGPIGSQNGVIGRVAAGVGPRDDSRGVDPGDAPADSYARAAHDEEDRLRGEYVAWSGVQRGRALPGAK